MPDPFAEPTARPNSVARGWLRSEGAVVFTTSLLAYGYYGMGWTLSLLLFLAPDVSMVGYLAGARTGATVYNIFHTYAVALAFGVLGFVTYNDTIMALALIWTAHIGFDRMLGYGLKLGPFQETHLGRIGRE